MLYINNFEGLFRYSNSPQAWSIVGYFSICVLIATILAIVPQLLAPQKRAVDKNTAYECGFEPFIYTSEPVETHFIVVAILFVIFDLEVITLVPLSVGLQGGGYTGFLAVYGFCCILVLGLFYEWVSGALSWPIWTYFIEYVEDEQTHEIKPKLFHVGVGAGKNNVLGRIA